ncbi:phosphomannomutase/phosphoglucomutase [Marinobacter salicampi]|uniref:phosphomannomutase/phosphoglucomutase n=1 Tax=Marinobacter salicampi TaxID=435907 RepID=UPI00140C7850|nr:phosphomannomutase/phosphoglucomutase [Marinobacter salicampi]
MKLGKKKNTGEAVGDRPEQAPKQKKPAKSANSALKSLSSVITLQAAVVVIAGVVAAALLYLLVLQPAGQAQARQQAERFADQAAARIEQRLELLQGLVQGYATQPLVVRALTEGTDQEEVTAGLENLLPQVSDAFLFPYGEIPRRASATKGLGFASLDLARRAESGRQVAPDAYPRDGSWFVQIAAPVRNANSQAVVGSVLVVFDARVLTAVMQPGQGQPNGRLTLVQTVSGNAQPVVAVGEGSGEALTRSLSPPNWGLQYAPQPTASNLSDSLLALLVVFVPALVAAGIIWFLMAGALRKLRDEIASLIQWAHKAFGGERARLPNLEWDMAASLGEVLQRMAQVVEKRLSKATEAGRAQAPKASAPAAAKARPGAGSEEPLFQDKDMLDIDMLDGDEDVLGFGEPGDDAGFGVGEVALPLVSVSPSIFRAYDIRGIVGDTLTPEIVAVIGQAIGSEAISRNATTLCIGYDGRHSSPEFADALARGILSSGCSVIELGAVPTPVLYFATHLLETGSGVMVTGSHNPSNYNGLKMMIGGETLSGEAIQKLYQRIQTGDFESGQGARSEQDVRRAYLDRIVGDIAVAAPLKVVLDAGNGIAGELGPMLVEELGCEVVPLYCEVDGDFPNHHPDPGKPENLADLIRRVAEVKADIGLAFDGDGDRLGVVTNTGRIIWPDRLLMLFARDVVSRNPGADVIYDVKCSRRLANVISQAGGRPIMWKTGHSLMKAKMRETGALLAGEMSGHMFFKERWYGFDDGLYAAARLLEILGVEDRQIDEVFEEFPEDISTPELNVAVTDESKFALVDRLSKEGDFGDGNVNTIDGVRVEYPEGWGLCRASNTTPVLVLRFEAETEEALERIKSVFRTNLTKIAPDLITDF